MFMNILKKFFRFLETLKTGSKFLLGASLIAATSFVYSAVAAPPGSPYAPGQTLSPNCAPGDPNCTVESPQASDDYLTDISDVSADQGDILYFDGTDWTDLAPGTSGQFLKTQGSGADPVWGSAGAGDMLSSNNLSDVADTAASRSNLGLEIGADVQAWNEGLDDIAGLSSTNDHLILGNGSSWTAVDTSSWDKDNSDDLDIDGQTSETVINDSDTLAIYDQSASAVRKITRANFLSGVTGALTYQGGWDANTNSPSLSDGTGSKGEYYVATVAGLQDLGSGSISFTVGDWVVHNGSIWEKVDATNDVQSVAGKTGVVTLDSSDVGLGNVENTALSTWTGSSNITTLGTITTGTWNGSAVDISDYTNLTAGTNISLSGDALNVDDAFLVNDGDDTTSGGITMRDLVLTPESSATQTEGRVYYDSDDNNVFVYDGSSWVDLTDTGGDLLSTNNLSDLDSASTARTNLGLGNVENTAFSTWAGSSNITTLGTIGTGTWQGSDIAIDYIDGSVGTNGQVLTTDGTNVSWEDSASGSGDFSDGGDTAGADRTLGNTDNFDLGFLTNGTDRLHIENDGDVGIGTTTPASALDISDGANNLQFSPGSIATITGTANTKLSSGGFLTFETTTGTDADMFFDMSGDIQFRDIDSASNTVGILSGSTGDLQLDGVLDIEGTGDNYFAGNVGIKDSTPSSALEVNGTIRGNRFEDRGGTNYFIDPANGGTAAAFNGRVGIGTTAPTGKLNVQLPEYTDNVNTDSEHVIFSNSGDDDAGLRFAYDGTDNKGYLNVLDPAVAWGDLILQGAGKVGIGQTSPAYTLDVSGIGRFKENSAGTGALTGLTIEQSGTGDSILQFLLSGTQRWVMGAENSDNDTFKIASTADLGSDARFAIETGGNVGIGTSVPDDKLDVAGDIRVGTGSTGCVKDADGSVIAGTCSSDERLKDNITQAGSVLNNFSDLRFVTYNWNQQAQDEYAYGTEASQYGLVADEVADLFPELVHEDDNNYKTLDYSTLNLYSMKAVQELDGKVEGLDFLEDEEVVEPESESLAGRMLASLRGWFASTTNGIGDFFADRVHTKEICVEKTNGSEYCMTGDELEAAVEGGATIQVDDEDDLSEVKEKADKFDRAKEEVDMLKTELCSKDGSYSWCQNETSDKHTSN